MILSQTYPIMSVVKAIEKQKDYLTFTFPDGGTITLTKGSAAQELNNLFYGIDNNKVSTPYEIDTVISLSAGQYIKFYNKDVKFSGVGTTDYFTFKFGPTTNIRVYASGNILSLTNFKVGTSNAGFRNLFTKCSQLKIAPALPSKIIGHAKYYHSMFLNCTGLSAAPALPATNLKSSCYTSMFSGCKNLIAMPELPASILPNYCYQKMFMNCTSLKVTTTLSAYDLGIGSYANMFQGCTKLIEPPKLIIPDIEGSEGGLGSVDTCLAMFKGCTSLSAAPVLSGTIVKNTCYASMFEDCRSLTTAPELPASTLAEGCYKQMFKGCTNLNLISANFTDWSESLSATTNWLSNVSSNGTFYKKSALLSSYDTSHIPEGWNIINID